MREWRERGAAHHENVARLRAIAAGVEELEQVVKLPVNVATNGDWALHWLHGALLEHEVLHVLAQVLQVELGQQLALLDVLDPPIEVAHPRRPSALHAKAVAGRSDRAFLVK